MATEKLPAPSRKQGFFPLLKNYIAIARPDHWFKNIFMLPGVVIAVTLSHTTVSLATCVDIVLAIIAACVLASANYTINEWLDAATDIHHPTKKNRPSVSGDVKPAGVYAQWLLLATCGLLIALAINRLFLITAVFFLVMGIVYNVKPLRTKDRQYLDVISESINNPIRFMLGWFAIVDGIIPPSSILAAYWMGGAFLMAVKRYSEFRHINDHAQAGLYRKSFKYYDENSLLLSALFYALTASFLLGVFLIKYRIEFVIAVPFLSMLFVWYLKLGMSDESIARTPEKLYQQRVFIGYVAFLSALLLTLSIVDIPSLNILLRTITL